MVFWDRIFSLSIVFSRFTRVAACINNTLFLMLNIPLYEGTAFHLPIHQLIEICFYFLDIISNVTTHIGIQCLCGHVFSCLYTYIPRSGIAEYCSCIFNHLRNCQAAFWGGCAPFYNPASNLWGFQFLHILANICLFYFSHPSGCENLIKVLTFIPLRIMILSIILCAYWLLVYLLWRNVSSRLGTLK